MLNKETINNTEETNNIKNSKETPPDDTSGVYITDFLKISDPLSDDILLQKRGED